MSVNVNSETGRVDYCEIAGDTVSILLNYTDPDGVTQIDLTDETSVIDITSEDNQAPFPIALTEGSGLTIGGVTNNIVGTLTPAQTTSMGRGFYPYTLKLTNDTTGLVNTLIVGVIQIK